MSALVVDIAQALVTAINAASWSQSVTAVLGYMPQRKLQDFDELRVTVVPATHAQELSTRNKTDDTFEVDIGIQKQIDITDPTEVTTLLDLVDEINESTAIKYAKMAGCSWIGSTNEPIYDPTHLLEQQLFTSVLRLSYRKVV